MIGGMKDIQDSFAEGTRYDKPVVIEQQAIALEHAVAELPVRTAFAGSVSGAAPQGGDHLPIFWLLCAGHGNIAGRDGYGGGSRQNEGGLLVCYGAPGGLARSHFGEAV